LQKRSKIVPWLNRFALSNAILLSLIAIRYRQVAPPTTGVAAQLFNVFLCLGHLGALSLLALLPALILFFCFAPTILILSIAVIAELLLVVLCIGDTFVFSLYHFHLNPSVFELLLGAGAGDIFVFSGETYLKAGGIIAILVGIEVALGIVIWKKLGLATTWKRELKVFAIILFAALVQNFTYAFSDAFSYTPVTSQVGFLPAYPPPTIRKFLRTYATFLAIPERENLSRLEVTGLNYPLSKLDCSTKGKLPNVLILAIDSWRFDAISAEITPNIYQHVPNSVRFLNHTSGGNATRPGVFSLFYGLPATYWHSFLSEQRGPVLFKEFLSHGYEVQAFASANLHNPEFNRTVFKDINNLRDHSEGETPYQRDQDLTEGFKNFINTRDSSRPFFSFVFYDAPHAFDVPPDFKKIFQPSLDHVDYLKLNQDYDAKPFWNLYLNSVHFVDSLAGEVLKVLEEKSLLDNTIVIITGDHAQEFNETKKNYWGHNGNFAKYQTGVPFIVLWPGKEPKEINEWTSHFDIAPTLLQEVLGCSNPASDYSVGQNLFTAKSPPFLLLANYLDMAIVQPDQIAKMQQYGGIEITDSMLNPLPGGKLDPAIVKMMLEQRKRFYKN
jgi:membrane-anchored protein YejM (alkaline phosphatase superfamily)